ncbi:MAG TPA: murein biosynthesis integral membrane protein MurJ [Alphaproteobacteria bacterium]|nr:murein biosynthesis integral membrane protein MurJ [Alphaproteobacteria bacterium]
MVLIRSISTIGGFTLLSRLAGFLRDVLFAAILGAGPAADAFFVAFKLPNLFRRLFAEGAFAAAFVPTYSGLLVSAGHAAARRFAEDSLAVMLAVLFLFVCAVEVLMPYAMMGLAPGFLDDPQKFAFAVELTRITFPYLLFISLVALMGAVLNAHDRFAAPAAAPVILNLVLIAAVLLWGRFAASPAEGVAWGVAAAGILQFLWLGLVLARNGHGLALRLPRLSPEVKKLLRLMLPVALGAGVYQVNVVVDVVIGSLLQSGAISYLYYADRVSQLPLGVIGIAVATALLPLLSRQIRAGDEAGALDSQNRALEFALLLTVPAAFALLAAAQPIIMVLFGRGAFSLEAQEATAAVLAAYALGLPAHVLVKVLATGYFAREDTKTPVKVAVVALVVNVILNLILMGPFAYVGIALATSAAAWVNCGLLALGLVRRGRLRPDAQIRRKLPRMVLSSAVMGAAVWAVVAQTGWLFEAPETERLAALAGLVAAGVVLYLVLAQISGAMTLSDLRQALARPAEGEHPGAPHGDVPAP